MNSEKIKFCQFLFFVFSFVTRNISKKKKYKCQDRMEHQTTVDVGKPQRLPTECPTPQQSLKVKLLLRAHLSCEPLSPSLSLSLCVAPRLSLKLL